MMSPPHCCWFWRRRLTRLYPPALVCHLLAVPLVLQVWFWMSAIVYPLSALPGWGQELLQWNLMMPIVQGYQNIVVSPGTGVPWRGVAGVGPVAARGAQFWIGLIESNRGRVRERGLLT